MSRGIGKLQRHVLDRLASDPSDPQWPWLSEIGYMSSYALAASYAGGPPTDAQRRSMRRALHGLGAQGLVELRGRKERLARLPVSDAQRAAEETEIRRRREASAANWRALRGR
jgi:hypothetical protein